MIHLDASTRLRSSTSVADNPSGPIVVVTLGALPIIRLPDCTPALIVVALCAPRLVPIAAQGASPVTNHPNVRGPLNSSTRRLMAARRRRCVGLLLKTIDAWTPRLFVLDTVSTTADHASHLVNESHGLPVCTSTPQKPLEAAFFQDLYQIRLIKLKAQTTMQT